MRLPFGLQHTNVSGGARSSGPGPQIVKHVTVDIWVVPLFRAAEATAPKRYSKVSGVDRGIG